MADTTDVLREQAKFLDMPEEVYIGCSPLERNAAKARYVRTFRGKLRRQGHSEESLDRAVEEHMEAFPGMVRTNSVEIRKRKKNKPEAILEEIVEKEEEDPFEVQESEGEKIRVYHGGGSKPLVEDDAQKRDGPTVGPIKERERPPVDDLVGDRVPRTITDLYARWPIAEDSEFFLRIERTLPKRYQGVDVAGFVGEVRGAKISEAEIQRRYGGKEYKITLYGPDPRGKKDEAGNITIKALTDPITLVVPVLPPVITALPQEEYNSMQNPMNPFAPVNAPTTAGDASIHKANASFFADVVKLQQTETHRREEANNKATTHLLTYMSENQKTQLQEAKEAANRRETVLQQQLADLKTQLEKEKSAQGVIATQVAEAKDKSNQALMEFVQKMGPDKEAEIRRLSEYYTQQVEVLRRAHDDQFKALQTRHEGDLRRADERVRDTESSYRQMLEQERSQSRQMLDQERSQWAQREADLRTQMDKQTDNERKMAQQRIDDMKERHGAEIRQMEKAHERELRTIKEAEGIKSTVADQTHKMSLEHAQQRLEDAKADLERAREEAEEAKDLTAQLEKAERQAELLGFEKKDANTPKGPWERFAATAGAGLSQALSTANEWLPGVMAARQQQQPQAPALPGQAPRPRQVVPNSQQQQQQRQAPQAPSQPIRRRRGAEWAAEGVQVQPTARREPMGFDIPDAQPNGNVVPIKKTPPTAEQAPANSETANMPSAGQQIPLPPKFLQFFPPDALIGFLQQAENAVNNHVEPSGFADLMVAQYTDGASALVTNFTPKEVSEAVAGVPGAEASPLLRRDGKQWLDKLFVAIKAALAERGTKSPEAAQQTSA